jgi:hypothetical protein
MNWIPTSILVLALFVELLGIGFQDNLIVLIGALIAFVGGLSWWWFRVKETAEHA